MVLGWLGEVPKTVDPERVEGLIAGVHAARSIRLLGEHAVPFDPDHDVVFHRRESLPVHPNGMRFTAFDTTGGEIVRREYYSIGGGHLLGGDVSPDDPLVTADRDVTYPFRSGDELLARCRETGLAVSTLVRANEAAWRPAAETDAALLRVWGVMQECVRRGCQREGILPGGLGVRRRAPGADRRLRADARGAADPLVAMDWVTLWALAVNEENAAGGRVVTAPTNGAAGIVPAVGHYYVRFVPGADDEGVIRFLATAGAIAILYKLNASISGAEVGCQGEVGVACSMAAAGLTEVLGGTPAQVENAAEIGMEHNLGLTCDPVKGLVQVPCIERNAMGAVKAINAARLALAGDGTHAVSLDRVIATMRRTGLDMHRKYKETSRGGLAVNVTEC